MEQWKAANSNFCALMLCILNSEYSISSALEYFGINVRKEYEPKKKLTGRKATIIIPKEKLFDLYYNKRMTQKEIAKLYNTTQMTICFKLREYGIKARGKTEAMVLYKNKGV